METENLNNKFTYDRVLESINGFGKCQKWILFWMCMSTIGNGYMMNFIVYFQFLPHFLEICSTEDLQPLQLHFTNRTDLVKGDTLYAEDSFFTLANEITETYPDLVKNNDVITGAVYQNYLNSKNKSSCIYRE